MTASEEADQTWMRRALGLGRRGLGLTAPNPPVGCVLVRGGRAVGEGWHRRDGSPHAEIEALADARARGEDLAGACAYVSLEPCSSAGRTGACSRALVEAEITRVVWAVDDPNPDHCGRAKRLLEEAGIEVRTGVLGDEGRELLSGYLSVLERGRPEVILKTAQSLDGRVVRRPGEGPWLTGPRARHRVQRLRSEVEAILVGGATVRADDPALTLRVPHRFGDKQQPWRVVVTRGEEGRIPANCQLLTDANCDRTLIVRVGIGSGDGDKTATNAFGSISTVLEWLATERGVQRVLVEAGGGLAATLLEEDLVDEWQLVLGGWAVGAGRSSLEADWAHSRRFELIGSESVGEDLWTRWRPQRDGAKRPAAFFDRDGVINDNGSCYYVTCWEDFEFLPGAFEALQAAREAGFVLVLVTSQKGVGKGVMSESDLTDIHARMQTELEARNVAFERIEAYTGADDSGDRAKPSPTMVFSAAEALGLDLDRSWVVGDSDRDIAMGRAAGCRTIRVGGRAEDEPRADAWVVSTEGLAAALRRQLRS